MSKKNILLIDDDELFLLLTCRLLDNEPYLQRIDTTSTPQEAFTFFEKLMAEEAVYPDAVFIDLDMPQMNGLELAQQLSDFFLTDKNSGRRIPRLFIMSSSISQRDRQTVASLGFINDYMEKPLTSAMLRQALDVVPQQVKDRESMASSQDRPAEHKANKQRT